MISMISLISIVGYG